MKAFILNAAEFSFSIAAPLQLQLQPHIIFSIKTFFKRWPYSHLQMEFTEFVKSFLTCHNFLSFSYNHSYIVHTMNNTDYKRTAYLISFFCLSHSLFSSDFFPIYHSFSFSVDRKVFFSVLDQLKFCKDFLFETPFISRSKSVFLVKH